MLDIAAFSKCIRDNLKERRFGKERADEIIKEFEARVKFYTDQGKPITDAGSLAMREVFDRMSDAATEKAKRTAKTLGVMASIPKKLEKGFAADAKLFGKKGENGVGRGSRGKALGHAVKAMVAPDKRFGGQNYQDLSDLLRRQAFALMGDHLDKIAVGAFGRQKGKAYMPNMVREISGIDTGDLIAKDLAKGWLKVSDFLVDSFNAAGGSMKKLQRYLPQAHSAARLMKHGEGNYAKDHLRLVDWNKTRWPDGSEIKVADREEVLKNIFATKSSDGVSKIDPTSFRGQGKSVGNAIEQHRFLHYKDAESWMEAQNKYGDGNVFDVLSRHIGDMSHQIALVETFGPNPEMMMRNIQSQVRKMAYDRGVSPTEIAKMNGVLKNVVDPMMEQATRSNPMNPESGLAHFINTTSNLVTSAVLGSVSFASATGDLATTAVIRKINGMPMMGGMRFYFDSLIKDPKLMREIAATSGWIGDASVSHMYSVARFNNIANVGAEWSRRTADTVLRASGMVPLTTAARFRAQAETAAFLARSIKQEFDALPIKQVMARYDITAADWDVIRKGVKIYEPKPGVKLLRPIDILQTDGIKDSTQLFRKFQSMILSEARGMVPDSTVEASIALKGTARPDTMRGALLQSFAMYKNFPLTFFQMYGQYAMSTKTTLGRLGFVSGLAAATTVSGAIAVQLNELKNGRDPIATDDGKFWLKAFLKGGGAGIWGDFLYSTSNTFGGGPAETAAGPITGVIGDGLGILVREVGDIYSAEDWEDYDSKFPERMVDFAHRYTPGSSLWYAQNAFNKLFWEHMENIADPEASEKRFRRMATQERTYGNEFYWEPGESTPNRAPNFGNILGGSD